MQRRIGRVVECGGLENRCTARYRGFESLILRQARPSVILQRLFLFYLFPFMLQHFVFLKNKSWCFDAIFLKNTNKMKKIIIAIIFLSISIFGYSQHMSANLEYSRFYNPELGSYVETYLSVNMMGLKLEEVEKGKFQARVNLLMVFRKKDSIVDFSKTQIMSPIVSDTNKLNINFIDQQKIFST